MPDPSTLANEASRMAFWSREVRARLSSPGLPPARESGVVDELSQHLEDRYQESIAGGATPNEAARLALADFQSEHGLAQRLRQLQQAHVAPAVALGAPAGGPLKDVRDDLRYAARIFRKQPAFAATAVLTLALGIGATTAIFSVVNGVLLKPLPFHEPDRLVSVRQQSPHGVGTNQGPATYLTYRENQQAFEAIGAWDDAEISVTGTGNPERVQALMITASTLPLLRVQPVLGQAFSADDEVAEAPLRAMLSHGYWQRRFGGTPSIVGRTIVINGRPVEVIGVLPQSFVFLQLRPEVVLPLTIDASAPRGISFGFQALARLKPDVTLEQANADLARQISLLPPVFARLELRPNVRPLADDVIGDVKEILWTLLAAVGIVLLIACGNVANLFMVRAEARHQELATRAALGASRGRLTRALLCESLALALAGGVVGVVLAQATTTLLRNIAPSELPRVDDIGIDATVLLFTLLVSAASGVVFGLLTAWRSGNPSVSSLKEGGRSAGDAPLRQRARHALVVGQVALALTLLIVAGLMVRTFIAMRQVDPGFTNPEEIQGRRRGRSKASLHDWPKSRGSHPSASPRRSRWTARTTATLSRSRTIWPKAARSGRSGASRASRRGISRPWATASSQGARPHGTTFTCSVPSSWSPKRSLANTGRTRGKLSAGVCEGCSVKDSPRCRGARSLPW